MCISDKATTLAIELPIVLPIELPIGLLIDLPIVLPIELPIGLPTVPAYCFPIGDIVSSAIVLFRHGVCLLFTSPSLRDS